MGALIVPSHQAEREGTLKSYLRESWVPSTAFLHQSHLRLKTKMGKTFRGKKKFASQPPDI